MFFLMRLELYLHIVYICCINIWYIDVLRLLDALWLVSTLNFRHASVHAISIDLSSPLFLSLAALELLVRSLTWLRVCHFSFFSFSSSYGSFTLFSSFLLQIFLCTFTRMGFIILITVNLLLFYILYSLSISPIPFISESSSIYGLCHLYCVVLLFS